MIFAGVDWAEAHHDVYFQDEQGRRLAGGRLPEGVEGVARFHEIAAAHAAEPGEVVIGIETDRGLFAAALVAAGYQVFAVNPMSASRYRDRHRSSGAKSDPGDAKVLADLVRTDRHNHRPVAGDSDLAQGIRALARAHQSMIWARRRQASQLRSALREFYPAALAAFDDLTSGDALAVLRAAPQPALGAALSPTQITAALRRGGRTRRLPERTAVIQAALRAPQLAPAPALSAAMGTAVTALAGVIAEMNTQIAMLEQQLAADFEQHPDAQVVRSLPGLGTILGARVLGEFGDAPGRYATAKSRKNYAGTSPITRASGTRQAVLARHARNKRLADAIYLWAFTAITASPGARTYYDQHRAAGDTHHQALRALGNRLAGILHGCLASNTPYSEHIAWAHRVSQQTPRAA
ncbi:MAG TPA: IS110 family transposase [Streptosporangiaceae bacterium]|nr:IS110 family transposase [Streptosporangiaceae bacterium]